MSNHASGADLPTERGQAGALGSNYPERFPALRISTVRLPHCILLILSHDDQRQPAGTYPLWAALDRACATGFPAVWLDGTHVSALSPAAVRLVLRYGRRLQHEGRQLVLCRFSPAMRACFAEQAYPAAALCAQPAWDGTSANSNPYS